MSSTVTRLSLSQAIGTYGYVFTFVSGCIGHSCSLLTFSQRQLRSTSTSLVFLSITIFDIFYLFMSLYDFLLINLNIPQLSPYYISLCRFRTFILNFVQTTSAWLLVCITFDRVIRAHLPHRTRQWCTQRNVIIALLIIILCSTAFNSHVLQSSFVVAFSLTRVICGPSRENITNYTIFYYSTWPALQICINILIPALLMILCIICIYYKVRNIALVRRNQHLQNQMLLLMLSKTSLFLICTLPYCAYRMVSLYSIYSMNLLQNNETFLVATAILTILFNANFSFAFYIHCLTSTLFRQTFLTTIRRCKRHRQTAIQPAIYTGASMR